jgi:ABC-type branched-subunit amino acid transport system ATPase component
LSAPLTNKYAIRPLSDLEFARALADSYVVMDRGEVVLSGLTRDMVEANVRRYLTV